MSDTILTSINQALKNLEWFHQYHNTFLSVIFQLDQVIRKTEYLSRFISEDSNYDHLKDLPNYETIQSALDAVNLSFNFQMDNEMKERRTAFISIPFIINERNRVEQMVKELQSSHLFRTHERLENIKKLIEYFYKNLKEIKRGYETGNLKACFESYILLQIFPSENQTS